VAPSSENRITVSALYQDETHVNAVALTCT